MLNKNYLQLQEIPVGFKSMKKLDKLIKRHFASQSDLARQLGVTPQSVQQWVESEKVPSKRCIAIEVLTSGQLTRYQLNPEVFGIQA